MNESGSDLGRITLTIGDDAFNLGPLADGESETVSFVPTVDASLTLCIERRGREECADYGYVTRNLSQTHRLRITPDKVVYKFN